MSETQALIDELRAAGEQRAAGGFTLDPLVARQKMQQFQLADPLCYVLELVQAAVLLGATSIEFEIDADDMRMRFDGAPLDRRTLERLFTAMFEEVQTPEQQALRHLGLGLNTALGLEPRAARIESGALRLEMFRAGGDELSELDAGQGTRIWVKQRFSARTIARFFGALKGDLPEEKILTERCRYRRIPIRVNGDQIPDVTDKLCGPQMAESEKIVGEGVRGIASLLRSTGEEPPRADLVRRGVVLDAPAPTRLIPGLEAAIFCDALETDVSLLRVVEDERYRGCIDAARAATWRLVSRLGDATADVAMPDPAQQDSPFGQEPGRRRLRSIAERATRSLFETSSLDETKAQIAALRRESVRGKSGAARARIFRDLWNEPVTLGRFLAELEREKKVLVCTLPLILLDELKPVFCVDRRFTWYCPHHKQLVLRFGPNHDGASVETLRRLLPGDAVETIDSELSQALAARRLLRSFLASNPTPGLDERAYPLVIAFEGRGFKGQMALDPTQEFPSLRLVVLQRTLAYFELNGLFPGLVAQVEGDFEPARSFGGVRRSATLDRALGAVFDAQLDMMDRLLGERLSNASLPAADRDVFRAVLLDTLAPEVREEFIRFGLVSGAELEEPPEPERRASPATGEGSTAEPVREKSAADAKRRARIFAYKRLARYPLFGCSDGSFLSLEMIRKRLVMGPIPTIEHGIASEQPILWSTSVERARLARLFGEDWYHDATEDVRYQQKLAEHRRKPAEGLEVRSVSHRVALEAVGVEGSLGIPISGSSTVSAVARVIDVRLLFERRPLEAQTTAIRWPGPPLVAIASSDELKPTSDWHAFEHGAGYRAALSAIREAVARLIESAVAALGATQPAGAERVPVTPVGAEREPATSAGAEHAPATSAGALRAPATSAGALRAPATSAGALRAPTTSAGALREFLLATLSAMFPTPKLRKIYDELCAELGPVDADRSYLDLLWHACELGAEEVASRVTRDRRTRISHRVSKLGGVSDGDQRHLRDWLELLYPTSGTLAERVLAPLAILRRAPLFEVIDGAPLSFDELLSASRDAAEPRPIPFVTARPTIPIESAETIIVADSATVLAALASFGFEQLKNHDQWVAREESRLRMMAREPVRSLSLRPDEAIVKVPLSGPGFRGEIGLAANYDEAQGQSRVALCSAQRQIGVDDWREEMVLVGVVDDEGLEIGLDGSLAADPNQEARREAIYLDLLQQLIGLTLDELPRASHAAQKVMRRHLFDGLGFLLAKGALSAANLADPLVARTVETLRVPDLAGALHSIRQLFAQAGGEARLGYVTTDEVIDPALLADVPLVLRLSVDEASHIARLFPRALDLARLLTTRKRIVSQFGELAGARSRAGSIVGAVQLPAAGGFTLGGEWGIPSPISDDTPLGGAAEVSMLQAARIGGIVPLPFVCLGKWAGSWKISSLLPAAGRLEVPLHVFTGNPPRLDLDLLTRLQRTLVEGYRELALTFGENARPGVRQALALALLRLLDGQRDAKRYERHPGEKAALVAALSKLPLFPVGNQRYLSLLRAREERPTLLRTLDLWHDEPASAPARRPGQAETPVAPSFGSEAEADWREPAATTPDATSVGSLPRGSADAARADGDDAPADAAAARANSDDAQGSGDAAQGATGGTRPPAIVFQTTTWPGVPASWPARAGAGALAVPEAGAAVFSPTEAIDGSSAGGPRPGSFAAAPGPAAWPQLGPRAIDWQSLLAVDPDDPERQRAAAIEHLRGAILAELRLLRDGNQGLLQETWLALGTTSDPSEPRPVLLVDDVVTLNLAQPLVAQALERYEHDPLVLDFLVSVCYSVLFAAKSVTPAPDDERFHHNLAELALSAVRGEHPLRESGDA